MPLVSHLHHLVSIMASATLTRTTRVPHTGMVHIVEM